MRVWASLLIAGLIAGAPDARADGKRDLDDGIAFYENLDTDRALTRLKAATQATDLSPADKAKAFLYLGMIEYEIGNAKDAEQSWRKAFGLDVAIAVPDGTSPKVVTSIEAIRKDVKAGGKGTPDIKATPDVKPPPPDGAGGTGGAQQPGGPKDLPGVEPGTGGTTTPPPPPPPPPLTPADPVPGEEGGTSWVVWAGIGAAVIGAAVVTVLLVTSGGSECEGRGGCAQIDFR